MNIVTNLGIPLVASIILGVFAFYLSIRNRAGMPIGRGPWATSSIDTRPVGALFGKARMAISGIWALPASEAIYFNAVADSSGAKLMQSREYRIEGKDPACRWWSLTVYDGTRRCLIPNALRRYSISKSTVTRREDGSWSVTLSARQSEQNWLPLSQSGDSFVICLRCYQPDSAMLANVASAELPQIHPEGAR